jgi:hypothetical protein
LRKIAILGAGRDTTATLLSWLFVELAQNTEVFLRLREAILLDFGETEDGVSTITYSKLKSCRYLQYAIQETLRLHPPVPSNARQAIRNTTLPVGGGEDGTKPVAIRKGQLVIFTVYGMHRRKDIWGEDANEFRPGRWAGRKMDWSYLPFSGGPRICLGRERPSFPFSLLLYRQSGFSVKSTVLQISNANISILQQSNMLLRKRAFSWSDYCKHSTPLNGAEKLGESLRDSR